MSSVQFIEETPKIINYEMGSLDKNEKSEEIEMQSSKI